MQNPISTIRQNNLEKFIYQPPDHMKHSEKKNWATTLPDASTNIMKRQGKFNVSAFVKAIN